MTGVGEDLRAVRGRSASGCSGQQDERGSPGGTGHPKAPVIQGQGRDSATTPPASVRDYEPTPATWGRLLAVDRCDECGFVYEALATGEVPGALRAHAEGYGELILRPQPPDMVRTRPAPEVWSALEYTCHVRDVLLIQRDRVVLALVEDTPSFPPMYRDERVSLAGYQRECVAELVDELAMAANMMAKVFGGLSPRQLERRCIYNFPRATERDLAWLGRHTVHEAVHHLGDVQAVLTRVGGRAG